MIRYNYKSDSGEDYVPIFKVNRFIDELKIPDPDPDPDPDPKENPWGCSSGFIALAFVGVVLFVLRKKI
jgi:hypothetical protein